MSTSDPCCPESEADVKILLAPAAAGRTTYVLNRVRETAQDLRVTPPVVVRTQLQMRTWLAPLGYTVRDVPVDGRLHLKSAVTHVARNTLIFESTGGIRTTTREVATKRRSAKIEERANAPLSGQK
jgi:hypothetical protein